MKLPAQIVRTARKTVKEADLDGAIARVERLRADYPQANAAELSELLIHQKCRQAGAVGAVTSGASVIPGLGTAASLTFGVAADLGLTFRLQAELVLEIAAAHGQSLSREQQQRLVLLITGLGAGANHALRRAGGELAEQASRQLATRSVARAIPVLGVAASAGTNVVTTYVIGRRAQDYFARGPEALADWAQQAQALSRADRETLIRWLTETTERSWKLFRDRLMVATGGIITAGRSLGEVALVGTRTALRRAGGSTWRQIRMATAAFARFVGRLVLSPWRWFWRLLRRDLAD